MSVEAMAIVLHHSQADSTAKVVLLGIANHDGDGGAWPGIDTLARYARKDRRTVQRAIARCVELGELAVDVQQGGTATTPADRRTNRYRILLGCPADCDGTTAHRTNGAAPTPPREADGAAPTTERGGTHATPGAAPTPPEPSTNQQEPAPSRSSRLHPDADAVTREWWEATTPRPTPRGGFPAVRGIVSTMLKAGWSREQVLRALPHSQPVSNARLEGTLRRHKQADDAREQAGHATDDQGRERLWWDGDA